MTEISFKSYIKALICTSVFVILGIFVLNFFINNFLLSELIFCFNFFIITNGNKFFIGLFSHYKRTLFRYKILFTLLLLTVCVIGSFVLYALMKNVDISLFSKIIFYSSSAITFFIIMDIVKKLFDSKEKNNDSKTNLSANADITKDESDMPDIYHVLLDTHPGFATKKYCDENFRKELEKRGFHIYENYRSNYNITNLSVATLFNLDYIENLIGEVKEAYLPRDVLFHYKNNLVFKLLRDFGYDFNISIPVVFSNIFNNMFVGKNDVFFKTHFVSKIFDFVFFSSLFSLFADFEFPRFKKDVLIPFETFCNITNLKEQKHKFSFLHVLAPHIPYYTDENGVFIKKEDRFNIEESFFAYQKFINKKTLALLDEIKSTMKENSIIILHSDHCLGTMSFRYNILMAIYYPNKDDYSIIPPNGTLVNLYRCIFNKYFNCNYELLKDRFCYSNIIDFTLVEEKQ